MKSLIRHIRECLPTFIGYILVLFACNGLYAQGTIQRQVKISNANGNIVTLQTDTPTTSYTINFPNNSNPSLTTASLLYATGSGNLTWSPTLGDDAYPY
jgi:hypothetical protein